MKKYLEKAREIPISAEVDVVVCGGGPGGVVAAIAAAREGARVFLVERYGFLGGMSTAGLVITIKGFGPDQGKGPEKWPDGPPVVAGIPGELMERLNAGKAAYGDIIDPHAARFVLDEMVGAAGVQMLLHSLVVDAIVDNGGVKGVIIENKSGRSAVMGSVIIDATGDADVAYRAGATCDKGRIGDGALQPMTACFTLGDASYKWDEKCERVARSKLAGLIWPEGMAAQRSAMAEGRLPPSCLCAVPGVCGDELRKDHLWLNAIWQYGDASDAWELTRAEVEGRQKIERLMKIYASVPGNADIHLAKMGTQIGIRETRRVLGEYVLTEEDIVEARRFADSVAKGCWQIDIHSPDGGKTPGRYQVNLGQTYDIPYRCLVPLGIDNLLVAGRPISTTHVAHSSTRVMGTCMAVGQAAGAAAALAVREGLTPRHVDVARLRAQLEREGAIV